MIQQSHSWVYHLKKRKTLVEKEYTPMFTAELFKIAKICRQPKCPSQINE